MAGFLPEIEAIDLHMGRKAKRLTWISLVGQVEGTATGFRYIPVRTTQQPVATPLLALAKTDIYFSAGIIEFAAPLNSQNDRVQIVLNQGLDPQIFAGLNTGGLHSG